MGSCEPIQVELTGALAEGDLRAPRLKAHLQNCEDCRRTWNDMRLAWRTMGTLREEAVPQLLSRVVRRQVLNDLARGPADAEAALIGRSSLMSLVMGVLFSVASVWVLGRKTDLAAFSPVVLLSIGALWAALYAGATLVVIRASRPGTSLAARWVGLAGLAAMGLSLALTGSYSTGQMLDYCRMSPWACALLGSRPNQRFYFAAGGLYSLFPLLLAALLLGAKVPRHPLATGLTAGAVFAALALPGILLQCGAFSLGASLSWIFGAVAGSLAGGSAGSWVGAALSRRMASRSVWAGQQ